MLFAPCYQKENTNIMIPHFRVCPTIIFHYIIVGRNYLKSADYIKNPLFVIVQLKNLNSKIKGQDVNTPHEVNHFQIHGWSSDGAPENTQTTTELAQMLNEQYLNGNYYSNYRYLILNLVEQSIVVHCCSGAGPSGSFIGKFE